MGEVCKPYQRHLGAVLRIAAAAAAVLALVVPALSQAAHRTTEATSEASLLRQMNTVRAQHGLGRLTLDRPLQRAARAHSHEMIAADVFQHGAFASRMAAFHVRGSLAGENLAWGTGSYGSARGVVAGWLASPEHRANLLRPSFRRVGIASIGATFLGHPGARVVTADFAG